MARPSRENRWSTMRFGAKLRVIGSALLTGEEHDCQSSSTRIKPSGMCRRARAGQGAGLLSVGGAE